MSFKDYISITEARRRIFDLAEHVQQPDSRVVLTDRGKPKAVLMSAEEYESWLETIETLYDIPTLKQDIERAEREMRKGKTISLSEINAKGKRISSRARSKGTKKSRQH